MVKRRRRALEVDVEEPEPTPATADGRRADGPWDSSEYPAAADEPDRADFGVLSLRPPPDAELALQVDEESGLVMALLVAMPDGALDLRLFAAPRHEDIWADMAAGIVEEAKAQGGAAEEAHGPFGGTVRLSMPVPGPDGQTVVQTSTVHGVRGPRWLLRVTMFGRPGEHYDPHGDLETALRSVVVDRGAQAMVPGDLLPLRLPPDATPAQPPG